MGGEGVRKLIVAALLAVASAGAGVAGPLHVVVPGGPIAPGERVQLRAEPPAASSERESWFIVSGPGYL